MENIRQISKEESQRIVDSIIFPNSGEFQLKTISGNQYYIVRTGEDWCKEYRLIYVEDDSILEDGIYDASIFQEITPVAPIQNLDGLNTGEKTENLISLK